MQMKAGRQRLSTFLAAAALLTLSSLTHAQPAPDTPQSAEGAWNVTINYDGQPPCASAPAVFTREGTIIADSCSQNVGVGYGSWVRTGNRQFASTFIGNLYGPGGVVVGRYKVRASGSIDATGNTFSALFRTDLFDTAGNPIGSFTGTVTATRIRVEPL
jgi:hypothetical protein